MSGKCRRIANSCCEHRCCGTFCRLYDSYNSKVLPICHQFFHVSTVVRFVLPDLVFWIIFVIIRTVYKLEAGSENLITGIGFSILWRLNCFLCHKFLHHIIQLFTVPKAQCVLEKIADISMWGKHQHTFLVIFRPSAGFHIILIFVQFFILRHFVEHICTHGRRHNAVGGTGAKTHGGKGFVRIYLADAVFFLAENLRGN